MEYLHGHSHTHDHDHHHGHEHHRDHAETAGHHHDPVQAEAMHAQEKLDMRSITIIITNIADWEIFSRSLTGVI